MAVDSDFDLGDVMLEAVAEIQEIMREVVGEITEPQRIQMIASMWTQMPEEMKEQFKKDRPQEYAAMMEAMTAK